MSNSKHSAMDLFSRRAALTLCAVAIAVAGAASLPAVAQAQFGIHDFDVFFADAEGAAETQAGSHPHEMTISFEANTEEVEGSPLPVEATKDLVLGQVPGFVGDQTAVTPCSTLDFLTLREGSSQLPECSDASAVGLAEVSIGSKGGIADLTSPLYFLNPSPGSAAKLGFWVQRVQVTVDIGLAPARPHNFIATISNISQVLEFFGSKTTIWGVPADPDHDELRGACVNIEGESTGVCPAGASPKPFLTLPRACEGPLPSTYALDSWANPGVWVTGSALTHDAATPPNPQGMSGCGKLGFGPAIVASPTTRAAQSPSGLDFSLDVSDEGLKNPAGLANADIDKTVVTLPAGMTVNPSQAEGLEVCTEAQLGRETAFSAPGEGCPGASKIGTIEVETPLLGDRVLKGALYVAEPYRNPFGSLIALYIVVRDAELGVIVTQPLKVVPDPVTGQLITTAEDIISVPLSHFRIHFREGGRAPLISPPGCGNFDVKAMLFPSTGGGPVEATSSFELVSGPNESACPSGAAPFSPSFEAGTRNNAAGSYSPFDMRITRKDGEQDITKFSSVLPPGVVARLAGTSWCPESGIARAKSRTGENGGQQEIDDPSCPPDSKIGATIAGAGVGSQLTYVPGSLYLAGHHNGAPLSVVAIVPAVAGPFDAGTVVVRVALRLNPKTGQAEADGAASDPIPHILQGIPLNVRELRVQVDRPDFTLNATSCAEAQARATLFGGGTVLDPRPDSPVGLASRYQAASCASLAFKPRLALRLYGGTRRGAFPAIRAIVRPPAGQANFRRAVVTLPRSAFLEQGHIRTICTRVQFAAGAGHGANCPKGAVYGSAKAWSPLIDGPATGPVYLRSSNNKLPDLVVALKGPDSAPVDVELSARIDSVRGGIRSIFTGIPDVPVSRFVLAMQGGNKGLIVNSRNLCAKPARNRARASLLGQNGRRATLKPVVRAVKCAKKRKKAKRAKHSRAAAGRTAASR